MSGLLNHPPSRVVQQLLVDLGYGNAFTSSTWPVLSLQEPDHPDNCITVYDTEGLLLGRFQVGGETQETYGVQIRVRASDDSTAFAKCNSIHAGLDSVHLTTVTVTDSEEYGTATQDYTIYNISRRSGPLRILQPDVSNLFVMTLNILVTLQQA